VDALTLKGSDLTSFDIRFDEMSLTQLTKAGKQQHVMELVTAGVLNPQMDRDLIIRMLELGITDELYDGLEIDVQQALNENAKWTKGELDTITRDFFNHEVHVAQHNKFRKGDEYTQLPPEAQMLIDMHVQEHMEYIMQAMMPAPGTPTAAPGEESGMDVNRVMGSLTPEEQDYLNQNPQLLEQMGGQANGVV